MTSPVRVLRMRHGVPASPRGDGMLRVGADPAHRVLLPDTAVVARTLAQLRHGIPVEGAETSTLAILEVLRAAGLLVDVATERLLREARAATRVALLSPAPWRELGTGLLGAAGLTSVDAGAARDLTWVLSAGEPLREVQDPLVRDDEPILFTAVFESRVRVGPFVLPGTTACLRCIDAQTEPWPPPATSRLERAPEASDVPPLVLHRAATAAVADLVAWAEGSQPATWSATHWYDQRYARVEERWQRHRHCGCSWADTLTG